MANKIVTLKDKSNNELYPVVLSSCIYDENNNPIKFGATVIESYISSDGLTWYRKWSDGWKECGVTMDTPTSQLMTFTLPISFTNTNYTVMRTNRSGSEETPTYRGVGIGERSVNSVNLRVSSHNEFTSIYCCGY